MTVAVIGYGRFGRLLAHALKRHADVGVVDTRHRIRLEQGVERISLAEAAEREIIFLAVPVRSLRTVLTDLAPRLRPGAIVADVCAVKEEPLKWMREILPRNVSFIGTHPLFGPDSAGLTLSGNSIVLCAGRISREKLRTLRRLFSQLGLTSHLMSPEAHDRQIAATLFVTQFLGRSLGRIPIGRSAVATPNARALHRMIDASLHDSRELFEDLFRYNQHTRLLPARLLKELKRTLKLLPPR